MWTASCGAWWALMQVLMQMLFERRGSKSACKLGAGHSTYVLEALMRCIQPPFCQARVCGNAISSLSCMATHVA